MKVKSYDYWQVFDFGIKIVSMFLPIKTTTSCLVSSQGEVEFYGIRNIKIFAREIVASKGSKFKVITPDWIQEFQDTQRTQFNGNGKDGEKGQDGEAGPHGRRMPIK